VMACGFCNHWRTKISGAGSRFIAYRYEKRPGANFPREREPTEKTVDAACPAFGRFCAVSEPNELVRVLRLLPKSTGDLRAPIRLIEAKDVRKTPLKRATDYTVCGRSPTPNTGGTARCGRR
jgi:hypothetical protein